MNKNTEELLTKSLNPFLYGSGEAKSWQSLLNEIESGDCSIEWSNDGIPVRVVRVLAISVCDPDDNKLYEAYQEFADGRRRGRGLWGVSEKLKTEEDLQQATVRAIKEELGIDSSKFSFMVDPCHETEEKYSPSYPGLKTRYIRHFATVYLDFSAVKDEYIEIQPDKKTVFVWR